MLSPDDHDNPQRSDGDPLGWLGGELASLEARQLRRVRPRRTSPPGAVIELGGRSLINFGSNDYLNLAADPRLATAAAECGGQHGIGAGASPLVTGYGTPLEQLERQLAEFEETAAALVFSSGFAANMGTIAALVDRHDCVLGDRLNHASLIDGCRLSGAYFRSYRHGDWQHLEQLLERHDSYRRTLIVTDTLFSMDGDLAPLVELVELAERHGAMLAVDEAHATGVFGPAGRGVVEHFGLAGRVPIRIGTLSKALGTGGGFVAGSQQLIDWLVQRARSYVFSTAIPASNCAAASAALDVINSQPEAGRRLLATAAGLRQRLADQGWNTADSASQIIPLIVGEPGRALELSRHLAAAGFRVPAIRPPTVPPGSSRLRISLTSAHTPEMIDSLVSELGSFAPACGE